MNGCSSSLHNNNMMYLEVLLFVLGLLGFCAISAFLNGECRCVVFRFFEIFYHPLRKTYERLMFLLRQVWEWIKNELKEESASTGQSPVYYLIGSIIMTMLTGTFVYCDFGVLCLTFFAMGIEEKLVGLLINANALIAATLVTSSLFWGMIIFDIAGITHLGPWQKTSPFIRKILLASSFFFIALTLFIAISAGAWRAQSLNQVMAMEGQTEISVPPPELHQRHEVGSDLKIEDDSAKGQHVYAPAHNNWIISANLMGIAALSICSSAVSMVGLAIFFKFFLLAVVAVGALAGVVITYFLWLISIVVRLVQALVQSVLGIVIKIGNVILSFLPKSFLERMKTGGIPVVGVFLENQKKMEEV